MSFRWYKSERTAKGNPVAYLQRLDEDVHNDMLHTVARGNFAWQLEVPDNACAGVAVSCITADVCRLNVANNVPADISKAKQVKHSHLLSFV